MKPQRQKEASLSDAIRAALAHEPGLMLMRNSVGVLRSRGRVYHTGLGNGSADLVGVLSVAPNVSTPATGRFVALEVKRPGEIPTPEDLARIGAKIPGPLWTMGLDRALAVLSPSEVERAIRGLAPADRHVVEQDAWLANVRRRAGFACYVDTVEGARAAVARARRGEPR